MVILLLDSCMEAINCHKKDSACMCIARGRGLLHSPENFCTLLPIVYTHSPKVLNKNDEADELHSKINHRQFYCFSFITCKVGILSV